MNKRSLTLYTIIIIFIIIVSIPWKIYGQDTDKQINKKNYIQIEGATLKFIGMYSVTYEHLVLSLKCLNLHVSSGLGGWYFTNISEWYSGLSIPLSLNGIIGGGNSHFEFNLGLRYRFFNENSDKDISPYYPLINIGYRYQNPNGKGLIFRTYIGYTGIGLGIGKAF